MGLALITGASSGIGLELAKQFAEHGHDLVVAAEDSGVRAVATALSGRGTDVRPVQTDLRSPEGVETLYQQATEGGRQLDAAALNAGVGLGGPSFRLLFTSSVASTMPGSGQSVYYASESFIHSFAETLRDELRSTAVTVTSLMPGPTETNFFHRAKMDDTRLGHMSKDEAAKVAQQGFDALMRGGRVSRYRGGFGRLRDHGHRRLVAPPFTARPAELTPWA